MKEIALTQLEERMWISDVGSLNFRLGYACEILRCRGTRVVLQGDPLWLGVGKRAQVHGLVHGAHSPRGLRTNFF